ncbi:MAG: glycosyl hydrolase [Bacteroidota bacterium]
MKKIFFVLLMLGKVCNTSAQVTRIEAESGSLTGDALITNNAACSGGKFVQMRNGDINFSITITQAAFYDFYVYAASPYDNKTQNFVIKGNSAAFTFLKNASYTRLKAASFVSLAAGTHTVSIIKNWGYIDVDYIEMEKVDPSTRFNIDPNLNAPNPIQKAVCLYDFLKEKYGKKILSGAMTLSSFDESNWLLQQTGKEPVVLGLDFMHANRGYTWYNNSTTRNDAKTWYNKGGVPVICWHWRDPSRNTESFYTSGTSFDVSKIFDPLSAQYAAMIQDIDFVAQEFLKLQADGIPVIWRPLHEAAGGWFWWGAKGGAACKELWQIMYNRIVNYHGVNNLIWVWTYEPGEGTGWYPGDNYVDMVGRDLYRQGNHSSQILEFNTMNDVYSGTKMISLSECGSFPDVDNLTADGAAWSWYMTWYGDYTRSAVHNSLSLWNKMFASDYVLTLDEMPGWSFYCSTSVGLQPESTLKLEIYPNPASQTLYFKTSGTILKAELIDMFGNINTVVQENNLESINIEGLPAGMYILKLYDATGFIAKKVFVDSN